MFRFWSRVKQSTPEEALASLRGDGLLIDVRSHGEFRAGHAKGARSIPLTALNGRANHLPGERAIHLICASGNRSRAAARMPRKGRPSEREQRSWWHRRLGTRRPAVGAWLSHAALRVRLRGVWRAIRAAQLLVCGRRAALPGMRRTGAPAYLGIRQRRLLRAGERWLKPPLTGVPGQIAPDASLPK